MVSCDFWRGAARNGTSFHLKGSRKGPPRVPCNTRGARNGTYFHVKVPQWFHVPSRAARNGTSYPLNGFRKGFMSSLARWETELLTISTASAGVSCDRSCGAKRNSPSQGVPRRQPCQSPQSYIPPDGDRAATERPFFPQSGTDMWKVLLNNTCQPYVLPVVFWRKATVQSQQNEKKKQKYAICNLYLVYIL